MRFPCTLTNWMTFGEHVRAGPDESRTNFRAKESSIHRITVSTYIIPADFRSLETELWQWDRTTLVLVEASSGDSTGIGYTYGSTAAAALIRDTLIPIVIGLDAMSPTAAYEHMWRRIRNLGRPGLCAMGISAVDCALMGPESPPVAIFLSLCSVPFAPELKSTVAEDSLRIPMRNWLRN